MIASDYCRLHFDEVIKILVSLNRKIKRLIINSFGKITKVINLLEITVKQNILPTQNIKINTVLLPLIVEENFRIHFDELIKILISLRGKKNKAAFVRDNPGLSWLELEEGISYFIIGCCCYCQTLLLPHGL